MANPVAKLRLGYCAQCSPPVALAAGVMSQPPKHFSPKDRKMHTATMVDLDPDDTKQATETPAEYLERLIAKYVTKK